MFIIVREYQGAMTDEYVWSLFWLDADVRLHLPHAADTLHTRALNAIWLLSRFTHAEAISALDEYAARYMLTLRADGQAFS